MERCFSCAEIGKCTELYARKPFDYRGPYFPIFERFNPPSSSNSISAEGTVKVCELCHIFLLSQWQNYERQGVVESRRIYFTKRHDSALSSHNDHYLSSNSETNYGNKSNYSLTKNGDQRSDSINSSNKTALSVMTNIPNKLSLVDNQMDKNEPTYESNMDVSNKHLTEHHICCFVCGLPCLKWHAKTAYSSQVLENKEYFPFFEKLDAPQLSIGLTNGATKICMQCESDLQKQWEHYESLGTDQMMRTYHITNEHNNSFSITNPGRFITNSMVSNPMFSVIKMKNTVVKCALCPNKVIDPYTVSWSQRTSCLYISSLKNFTFPTEGVIVDKQSEEAIICDVCHYFLSYQMQAYNANMTPNHLREYKLPKVGSLSPVMTPTNEKQNANNRKPVTLGSSSSAFSAPDGWQQSNSQSKRSRTPTQKNRSKTPIQFSEVNRLNSTTKSNVSTQDQSNVLGPIIANCHICLHELRDPTTLKTLPSIGNEEIPDQAYFPFLKTLRSNSMKNYEFPVCVHCFYNLHGQWRMFQKVAVPIYERKYNHNEFMCTQCHLLFARKSEIVIARDRLLCVSCSESRSIDVSKCASNVINQDTDAASHNSLHTMKAKSTLTVTPVSSELSCPNLASLNYTETMKQLNATKLFEPGVPCKSMSSDTAVSINTEFNDISRNSSLPSDPYQNSKNIFAKSMKRPVVAAVAPNQRQNTPHISSESMAAYSDLRMKMPEIANFHGNLFNQNSAFNYSSAMFPSNPAFGLHSPHAPIANMSSQYFDHRPRINPPVSASNPFINWTQQQHPPEPSQPYPMQSLSNPFDQSFSNSAGNKEAEMTMLLYMMYQKQLNMASDPGNKFSNSWLNNPMSLEEVAANYYQSMMSQTSNPAMFPTEDMLAASNNGSMQSYMMNAAMANYQYTQMLQMLAACQQQASPSITSKPPANVPGWFNQLTMADQMAKRPRQDSSMYDQLSHQKASSIQNGYNNTDFNIFKYSEMLKSSTGNEPDKTLSQKYPSVNMCASNQTAGIDSRQSHNHRFTEHAETFDKSKTSKQSRDEPSFCDAKALYKPSSHQSNNIDQKNIRSRKSEAEVLDLSQNRSSSYKSPYAIDSLTELGKSCEFDSQDLDLSYRSSASLSETNDAKLSNGSCLPLNDLDEPLNMYKKNVDKVVQVAENITEAADERIRLLNLLTEIRATSLVDVLSSSQLIKKERQSIITNFTACPTVLKVHKFINELTRLHDGSDANLSTSTRCKSAFLKELGLQNEMPEKNARSAQRTECYILQHINKSPRSRKSVNEHYWTKWILKHLQQRLSARVKPHLRRSLMRPVLSGDIEVRLCTAKHKHELEGLRSIIKILARFT